MFVVRTRGKGIPLLLYEDKVVFAVDPIAIGPFRSVLEAMTRSVGFGRCGGRR